jgi:DNA-binding FadR family transcriptional regulator
VADFPAPAAASAPGTGPSRRSVVAAGLAMGLGSAAALALAGCSDEPKPGSRQSTSPAGLAPDVAVATRALTEIQAVREAVSGTIARFPATRATIGSLVALHRAHEATLVDAVPDRAKPSTAPAPYAVPRNRDRAVAAIAAREQRLHDTLDRLAVRAQSGQFARLLASMGAAVHQRLATWPA